MLVDDTKLDALKDMTTYLLVDNSPRVSAEIDGQVFQLEGEQARAFGRGMQAVLKALDDEVVVEPMGAF